MSNSEAKMIRVIVALVEDIFRLLRTIIGHDVFWNVFHKPRDPCWPKVN
jgi:hypothetical protein